MLTGRAYKRWLKRQAERRAKMKALLEAGEFSQADIARRFGISRERVRQIIKMGG